MRAAREPAIAGLLAAPLAAKARLTIPPSVLARADEGHLPNTSAAPASVADEVAGYVDEARRFEPQDARYLMNHRGRLVFVKPEERRFITATLIRETTFTATEGVLKGRVAALRDAGHT